MSDESISRHCIRKDLGAKVPFIDCSRDPLTVGCPPVSELTLCDICSDAEVQPARAAVP